MKRPLIYAAGGFVLGEVCVLLPVVWSAGIFVLVTAGVRVLWKKRDKRGRVWLWWILPLFLMLGMGRMYEDREILARKEEALKRVEGLYLELEGDVAAIEEGEKLASLKLKGVALRDKQGESAYPAVLVYVDPKEIEREKGKLRIGMRVSVRGKLEGFSRLRNPGGFDYEAYYHALGIEGKMYGENLQVICQEYSPYLDGIYRIKSKSGEILKRLCSQEDQGIFQAIVLGEKKELSGDIRKLYQKNGIAHLLAVSGLHVSMIGMGLYHLLRKAGIRFGKAGVTAAVVTISYGIMTGGSASVVRAVMMLCLQLLADRLGRTYDMLSAMAAAALFLLVHSPSYLFQSGFQLSFGAVLAVGAVTPVLARWLEVKSRWKKTILLNGAIQIVTYPIMAYHFFEYPLYGMALNLLVIPLMGYVLISGLAGIGFGMVGIGLETTGIFQVKAVWRAGEWAIGTGHYILAFYQWLCTRCLSLPGAVQVVGRPGLRQIGLYGGMWIIILAVAWRNKEGKDKKRGKKSKAERIFVLLAGLTVGCLILKATPPKGLQAVFLDVGQGDGICLRTGNVAVLVDGGSSDEKRLGEQVVEPFLKSQGIRAIDYAIVSHGDQDHISGLSYLMESSCEIKIKHLILPWLGKEDEAYEKLQQLAEDMEIDVHWMKAGDTIWKGKLELKCLYAGQEEKKKDRNEHSLLIQASYGDTGILLTGDMSEEGEKEWLKEEKRRSSEEWRAKGVQILKAAHHGSAYSNSEEFLRQVRPDCAIISCGQKNRYGHPSPETIERLMEQGTKYLVTMEHGAVIMETDGRKVIIR